MKRERRKVGQGKVTEYDGREMIVSGGCRDCGPSKCSVD